VDLCCCCTSSGRIFINRSLNGATEHSHVNASLEIVEKIVLDVGAVIGAIALIIFVDPGIIIVGGISAMA
jgi:hypothetical protein